MDKVAKIIELRQQGRTYAEIGVELGISKQRVHQLCVVDKIIKCSYCGKESRKGQFYCSRECGEAARDTNKCECGVKISRRAKRCNSCQAKHYRRIDEAVVVRLYNGGVSGCNIAKYFGVTNRIVYKRLSATKLRRGYTERGDDQRELIERLLNA